MRPSTHPPRDTPPRNPCYPVCAERGHRGREGSRSTRRRWRSAGCACWVLGMGEGTEGLGVESGVAAAVLRTPVQLPGLLAGPGCWRDAAGWLRFFPGLCLSFSLFYVFLFPIKSALSHFLHEKQGSFSKMNSSSSSKAPVYTEK